SQGKDHRGRRGRALAKSRLQGYIAANLEGEAMSDAGAPRPVSPVLAGTTSNKERTLLIADDDAAFRNRIARALELRGFIVTAVGSVAEALAQTARPPAFAVLDLRLGDGNGLELVGPLRQARPDLRIVVLTGYGNIATGGAVAVFVGLSTGLPAVLLLPLVALAIGVVGILAARIAILPLASRPPEATFVATIALAAIIEQSLTIAMAGAPRTAPPLVGSG